MGIKRIVDTDFWLDDKVVDMFSPEDKLFFLYLMTNPHTTQLGIYQINRRVMAFEIGYSTDSINVLLDRFENDYKVIRYSKTTSEVAIKNYLRHSIIKGGKPVQDLLVKEINHVKDKSLLQFVYSGLSHDDNLNDTVKSLMHLFAVSNYQNDNDNDNDNENEVSYHDTCNDSYHDSYHDTSKKRTVFKAPTVDEVRAYCQERENSVDSERFVDFYASKGWMVGKTKMKDWKATVRNWERSEKAKTTTTQHPDKSKKAGLAEVMKLLEEK